MTQQWGTLANRALFTTCLLFTFSIDAVSSAQEPQPKEVKTRIRLAVTSVKLGAPDIDPVVGESLSSVLAAELALRGAKDYEVMSRNDLRQLLGQKAAAQMAGCDSPDCTADIAKAAQADQMVTSTLNKVGEEWVLTLELFDIKLGQVMRRQAVSWKGNDAGLVELVRPYVTRLLEGSAAEEYRGAVQIIASEEKATVRVDETEVGETPVELVKELPIGRHRVRILKSGYVPFETDVVVNRNETTLLQADLIDKDSLKPWYAKWWVWASAGAGIAAAVVVPVILTRGGNNTSLTLETPLP